MVKDMYRNLRRFSTFLYQQLKITHCWKRACKSARISGSIIAMKIGPLVSYIEWPGELGSIGCVFIACSLQFVHLRSFFPKLYASYFPWNLSFFFLAQVCYTADCSVLTLRRLSCSSTLPLFEPRTNKRWAISKTQSCEQVPPLPPYKAASRINSAMNLLSTSFLPIALWQWPRQPYTQHTKHKSFNLTCSSRHGRARGPTQPEETKKWKGWCMRWLQTVNWTFCMQICSWPLYYENNWGI